MREEKDEIVNKASPAIHIQNTITLLQRKAWTVLLSNRTKLFQYSD
jgi:hypothetical protein